MLARLGESLSLDDVAAWCDLSPAHFHREFKRLTGETLARYVQGARLDKAAHDIVLHDNSILEAAMAVGYENHETFTRAFRRVHGTTPSAYRFRGRHLSSAVAPQRIDTPRTFGAWQISATRLQHTRDLNTATLRSLGAYEDTPASLWGEVQGELARQGIEAGALVGLAHDSPGTTPQEQLRFDAGAIIHDPAACVAPPLRALTLPGRMWAVTLYAGEFAHLPSAYQQIVAQVMALPDTVVDSGAVMEVYHTHHLRSDRALNYLEVYVPVVSRSSTTAA